jgi:D-amino peptidase
MEFKVKLKKMFLKLMVVSFIIALFSLSGPDGQMQAVNKNHGTVLLDPAADKDGKIKILLYYDMEGVSGIKDLREISYRNKEYYEPAREVLTSDVNAVVEGLFAGGAHEVHIVDAHGSGNPEPDILLDKLDKRAKMIFKDKRFRGYIDLVEKDVYDAVAVVCMHASTGGGGFAAHTYDAGLDWIINDKSINETEIITYAWGQVGVPLIFAAGDDKLKEQLSYMTWLQYVTVKFAKGHSDAEPRPADEVYKDLKASAQQAVKHSGKWKAIKLTLPVKAQLRVVPPAELSFLEGIPGINYKDNTVTFEAATYQEAYDGIQSLIGVAVIGHRFLLFEVVEKRDDAEAINKDYIKLLYKRWSDVEDGKWTPPKPPETKKTSKKKYFGAR